MPDPDPQHCCKKIKFLIKNSNIFIKASTKEVHLQEKPPGQKKTSSTFKTFLHFFARLGPDPDLADKKINANPCGFQSGSTTLNKTNER